MTPVQVETSKIKRQLLLNLPRKKIPMKKIKILMLMLSNQRRSTLRISMLILPKLKLMQPNKRQRMRRLKNLD